jgi:hypothetical protein
MLEKGAEGVALGLGRSAMVIIASSIESIGASGPVAWASHQ